MINLNFSIDDLDDIKLNKLSILSIDSELKHDELYRSMNILYMLQEDLNDIYFEFETIANYYGRKFSYTYLDCFDNESNNMIGKYDIYIVAQNAPSNYNNDFIYYIDDVLSSKYLWKSYSRRELKLHVNDNFKNLLDNVHLIIINHLFKDIPENYSGLYINPTNTIMAITQGAKIIFTLTGLGDLHNYKNCGKSKLILLTSKLELILSFFNDKTNKTYGTNLNNDSIFWKQTPDGNGFILGINNSCGVVALLQRVDDILSTMKQYSYKRENHDITQYFKLNKNIQYNDKYELLITSEPVNQPNYPENSLFIVFKIIDKQ